MRTEDPFSRVEGALGVKSASLPFTGAQVREARSYHEVLYQKSIQHKFMVKSFKNNIILITDSKK